MDVSGLTKLDLAEIAMEAAQEEFDAQQYICQELATAIQAVQDFCEDTEHKRVILYELTEFQEGADNRLSKLRRKLSAAEQHYKPCRIMPAGLAILYQNLYQLSLY